jgi:hypothetical protein
MASDGSATATATCKICRANPVGRRFVFYSFRMSRPCDRCYDVAVEASKVSACSFKEILVDMQNGLAGLPADRVVVDRAIECARRMIAESRGLIPFTGIDLTRVKLQEQPERPSLEASFDPTFAPFAPGPDDVLVSEIDLKRAEAGGRRIGEIVHFDGLRHMAWVRGGIGPAPRRRLALDGVNLEGHGGTRLVGDASRSSSSKGDGK